MLNNDDLTKAVYMLSSTAGLKAPAHEMRITDRGLNTVWEGIAPNDIPKLYMKASAAYLTKQGFIDYSLIGQKLLGMYTIDLSKEEKEDNGKVYSAAIEANEKECSKRLLLYTEK